MMLVDLRALPRAEKRNQYVGNSWARRRTPDSTCVAPTKRTQLEAFLDEYRRRLPDRLGLIKHMTFVENVWFSEAITCDGASERVADILRDQILAG